MIRRVLGTTALALLAGAVGTPAQDTAAERPPVLQVAGLDYEFRTSTAEIPAGWTTVELENEGEETHMLEFVRIPEEGSFRDLRVYYGALDTLRTDLEEGVIDSAAYRKSLKQHVPEWLPDAGFRSGPGLVAPARAARTTVRLEPGTYAIMCFVADSAGRAHVMRGMRSKFTVAETSNGAMPPDPDVELRLADYEITAEGEMTSGEQTVAVRFGERPAAGEAPFQDIQLVRLDEGVSVEEVAQWDGSAPAPAEFLGGAHQMPAGTTAYVTVDLAPGRYAWVSNSTDEKGMKRVFTVK